MELNIRINYRNAAGDGDVYIVTDKKEEKDSVIFSWESGWTEEENAIRQVWKFVDDPVYPEPDLSAEEALNIIMWVVQ